MARRRTLTLGSGRLIAFGALFLAAAWVSWFASMRVGGERVLSFDAHAALNELAASLRPAGGDAWPVYERIYEEKLGSPQGRGQNELMLVLLDIERFGAQEVEILADSTDDESRALMERLRGLLSALDEAAELQGSIRRYLPDQPGEPSPAYLSVVENMLTMRRLAIWNAVALGMAADRDEWDEVIRRFRTGLAMARHSSHHPTFFERGVSIEMGTTILDAMLKSLHPAPPPEDAILMILGALEDFDWPAAPFEHVIEGERILLRDVVQFSYTDDGRGGGTLRTIWLSRVLLDTRREPSLGRRISTLSPQALLAPSRRQTVRMIDELLDSAAAAEHDTEGVRASGAHRDVFNHSVLRWFASSPSGLLEQSHAFSTRRAAAGVMLRIALYHSRNGRWPDSLLEAMTPEQSLDPVTGDPFLYERVEGDPSGRAYILRAPAFHPFTPRDSAWSIMNPP